MKEYYLSELLELKYGKDHKTLGNGTIPCYGSGGVIRYVNNSLYEKESILIPRKGSLNNLFFINKPFWTVDTLFWSIINEKIVLPRYLFYKLKNLNLSSFNEGSAVPSLTTKTLNKISIKIHDLKLQEKIVSILFCFSNEGIKIFTLLNSVLFIPCTVVPVALDKSSYCPLGDCK